MAEAEIIFVIEYLNSLLKENVADGKNEEMVERVIKELISILVLVVENKLEEEGSSLIKYLISDVVEIARDVHLFIHGGDPRIYAGLTMLSPMSRGLSGTRKRILQLRAQEAKNFPITSSSSPQEGDGNVVGLEQEVESVLGKLILREKRGHCIMCIVGMAGIGKTTLARKVYNHPTTVGRYERRVWVSFSGQPSNKEVLIKLILQLVDGEQDQYDPMLLEEMDNESLQQMLHQHLQGKSFLIVFDNIGDIPYFKSIIKALPEQAEESRLLLTSRFRSIKYRVPFMSVSNVSRLEIKPLDDDQSWQLFLKLLLFGNQQFPKSLEKKGREMIKSCVGLPLSIKEVATQFVIKRQNGSGWENF